MPNFEEINKARNELGLGETATLEEIKRSYRKLAHQYHPDANSDCTNNEKMKKLNWAYKLLLDYCSKYKYSFSYKDVARNYPEEAFYKDWYERWFDSI